MSRPVKDTLMSPWPVWLFTGCPLPICQFELASALIAHSDERHLSLRYLEDIVCGNMPRYGTSMMGDWAVPHSMQIKTVDSSWAHVSSVLTQMWCTQTPLLCTILYLDRLTRGHSSTISHTTTRCNISVRLMHVLLFTHFSFAAPSAITLTGLLNHPAVVTQWGHYSIILLFNVSLKF